MLQIASKIGNEDNTKEQQVLFDQIVDSLNYDSD